MVSSIFIIAASALTGLAFAQSTNYSTSGPISVVPDSVPLTLRQSWCLAQTNSCPGICGSQAYPNDCDPTTLKWECNCTNNAMPNFTNYQQTIPGYVCAQWVIDCTAAHPNDKNGQLACQSVQCGNVIPPVSGEPALVNTSDPNSTISSGSTFTASSTSSPTGSPTSSAATGATSAPAHTNAAQLAISVGQSYGNGIMAAGLLALFGLAL